MNGLGFMPIAISPPDRRNPEGTEAVCATLRQQLGVFGYQWVCSCAVFPVLRLSLTAHLGNELASAAGRDPPSDQELLAICWLPWFRKGWMPLELRLRLISHLDHRFREPVRRAIEQFL